MNRYELQGVVVSCKSYVWTVIFSSSWLGGWWYVFEERRKEELAMFRKYAGLQLTDVKQAQCGIVWAAARIVNCAGKKIELLVTCWPQDVFYMGLKPHGLRAERAAIAARAVGCEGCVAQASAAKCSWSNNCRDFVARCKAWLRFNERTAPGVTLIQSAVDMREKMLAVITLFRATVVPFVVASFDRATCSLSAWCWTPWMSRDRDGSCLIMNQL